MLVLTRKIGETFIVGEEIYVRVVDIVCCNTVRIGIYAPSSVPVYREVVWEQIQAENRAAADVSPDALSALEPRRPPRRPES